MSKVRCPSCGNIIEHGSKVCPYCGCQFTVCTECNAMVVKGYAICPSCGAPLEDAKPAPNAFSAIQTPAAPQQFAEDTRKETDKDYYALWEEKNKDIKSSLKVAEGFSIAAVVLGLILYIIGAIIVFVQRGDNESQRAALPLTRMVVLAIIVIGAIFFIINTIIDSCTDLYKSRKCGRWIRESGLDYVPYIKNAYANRDSVKTATVEDSKSVFRQFCSAAFLSVHPEKSGALVGLTVISCITALIDAIFGILCLNWLADYYLNHVFYGVEFTASLLGDAVVLVFLAVVVVVSIVQYIIKKVVKKSFDSSMEEWIKSLK